MPVLLLVAFMSQTATAPTVLSAAEREPAVIAVLTPFGSGSATGTSRLLRGMAAVLERRTDLRSQSVEQAGIDAAALAACPARSQLRCWTDIVVAATQQDPTPPRYLFGLAVRRLADGRDRVSISLLDTSLLATLPPSMAPDEREDAIFRRTPRTRAVRVPSNANLVAILDRLISESLAETLDRSGHWMPFGGVQIGSSCDGCEVLVDDRLIGLSRTGPLKIIRLKSGPRRIVLRKGPSSVLQCQVDIRANVLRTRVAESCRSTPIATESEARLWFRYGGLAAGLAGAALVTFGASLSADAPDGYCLVPNDAPADSCQTLGSPGFGFETAPSLNDDANDVNPSRIPIIAVGAGLLGAGATLAVGSWGWNDWPWWAQALLGIGIGGAAFGVGVAAGGGQ